VLQQTGASIGHALVAGGVERATQMDPASVPPGSTWAEYLTHFIVNDDQRGVYRRLPILASDAAPTDPFCLETDLRYLLVPLPEKVFMTAEVAELIAVDIVNRVAAKRMELAEQALGPNSGWDQDPAFYAAVAAKGLVARTYLTFGWKYKARALRNRLSDQMRAELLQTQLPRFVWVTELSYPAETAQLNPCERLVRAHVVVDATGSRFWDSILIVDTPGLSIFWHFDVGGPIAAPRLVIHADNTSQPYWPKIRGQLDYSVCMPQSQ